MMAVIEGIAAVGLAIVLAGVIAGGCFIFAVMIYGFLIKPWNNCRWP